MIYRRLFKELATAASLAAVYFGAAKFGLTLAFVNASASAVWPPTGIALAAFLLWGWRAWPGIWLGAFLANVTTTGSIMTSIGIAVGNTIEGILGAHLINRFANGRHVFERPQDIFKFVILAAMVSTTTSATLGVTSLCLGGFASWANYGPIWLTWWLGDAVGALVVAPVLVLWIMNPRLGWSNRQILEAAILLLSLFLMSLIVFGGLFPFEIKNESLEFLCIPFLIWAAFRFTQRETAAVACVLAGIAIWGTLHGFGPFFLDTPNESLLLLQVFMGLVVVMSLVLAATVSEHKRVEAALQRAHNESELRVQERTVSLSKAVEALHAEVAERKYTEEQLKKREQQLAKAQQLARFGSWEWDIPTNTVTWSDELYRIYGLTPQEFGASYEAFLHYIHPDDRAFVNQSVQQAFQDRASFGFEHRIVRPDGTVRILRASGEVILDQASHLTSMVGTGQDITESKQAEEALKTFAAKLERSNRELQEFASVASHDLQEPLRKVRAFGDLLRVEYAAALDAEGRDYLERMQQAASRMQTLISDMLMLAQLGSETRPFVTIDLGRVARDVVADLEVQLARARGRVELGELPTIEADPLQMRQLLQNLIGNALKFYRPEEPPVVNIQSQLIAGYELRLAGSAPNTTYCQISVADNGIGFDEKYLDRIFVAFQRLHGRGEYEGTGIGLAICRRIVERHGGNITATSTPGQGSTFLIWLPIKQTGERNGT